MGEPQWLGAPKTDSERVSYYVRTMTSVGMKCNVRAIVRGANKQRTSARVQCRATQSNNKATAMERVKDASKVAAAISASVLVAGSSVPSAQALTYAEKQALTYLQVKGSGLANTCPVLDDGVSDLKALKAGDYNISKFCLEPTSFEVKEEAVAKGKEADGIDYAATTVQLPGGERVPFLFTVKELVAKGNLGQFGGDFIVPSYRGSSFLDPKGRGATTGYDTAVALPAAGDAEELEKENSKSTKVLKGSIVFSTASINNETGEIAGVFESIQPSDTDLGAKAPKDIKITGLWYGQLS